MSASIMENRFGAHASLLSLATILVSTSCISLASPIPEASSPLVHSLATYATTNSFLYTNKLGAFNFRLTKPQSPQLQTYAKFVGFPYYHNSEPSTKISNNLPIFTSESDNTEQRLVKDVAPGEIQLLSTFLTPPKHETLAAFQQDKVSVEESSNEKESKAPELANLKVPLGKASVFGNNENINFPHAQEEIGSSFSINNFNERKLAVPEPQQSVNPNSEEIGDNKSYNSFDSVEGSSIDKHEEQVGSKSESEELENLLKKVLNVPFRRIHIGQVKTDTSTFIPNVETNSHEDQPQNRQDSNFEQPLPFFLPKTQKLSPPQQEISNEQLSQGQFPFLGINHNRFRLPSASDSQKLTFPSGNRFSTSLLPAFQMPTLQQPSHQPQSQPPSLTPGPNQYSPNGFPPPPPAPFTNNSPNPQFPPPSAPFQYPQHNSAHPTPEPENGYNPFHLHENYPEPPYESEFVNDAPLESESEEYIPQSQRSAGRNNHITSGPPPAQLDFAQSTLRNVRTEELLQVVQRKRIPRECAYNTISYGPNGEDCLEVRKK